MDEGVTGEKVQWIVERGERKVEMVRGRSQKD